MFWGPGADSPGWLVRCLDEFGRREINLTKIESRPKRERMGSYMFFVDLQGRLSDTAVAEAVAGLREICEEARVLGSYRAGRGRVADARTPRWTRIGPQKRATSDRHDRARRHRYTPALQMDSTVPPVVLRSVPPPEHRRRGPDSGRVLVLNATYEPINVCSVRRAVVLLLKEKAELLERGRWELHSESSTLARPVVIRLVSYVRVPRDAHRRKITRRAVFARDGWACQYCGSRSNLTVDHVIPRSKGGSSSWENIVASCAPCNRRKGDRLPAPGGDAPAARAAHTARGDLHPRRLADDPGGVAAVSAPGGLRT